MDPQAGGPTRVQASASSRMAGWPVAVMAAGTAVLYLLLIDGAIETFWSGSALRWWVAAVVLVYLAATIVVWRALPALWNRMGWSGRVTASAFVGLGLLALTVWMRGGTEQGIRAIGLSTPAVLCVTAAFAIVASAMILMSSPHVPLLGKWVVGALSLYGIVAFLLGAFARVPYAQLLNSGGFWVRLPRAMQGPFIAGVVILPLAIVIQVLDRLLPGRPATPRPWRFRQLTSLALVVTMVFAGLQVPRPTGAATGSGLSSGTAVTPACGGDCGKASAATILGPFDKAYTDFKRLVISTSGTPQLTGAQAKERLDYLFDAMEAARKEIRRETFDPRAIIDKVGTDPRALFAWVRDNTALVAYRGVLRGPVGVLMDRVGNSLDRSLLLAELLRVAGHKSRLAHAMLSDDQARALAEALKGDRPAIPTPPSADSSAAVDRAVAEYAGRFQVDVRAMTDTVDALRRQSAQAMSAGAERAVQQAKFIEEKLGNLVPRELRPNSGLMDAMRDHWWAQLQQNDAWLDLDLNAAKGEPGAQLAPAAETTEVSGLAADLFHAVTIRTVIEQWTPEKAETRTVLEQTLRPLDILGQSVMLMHAPLSFPQDLDLSKEKNPLERVKSLIQDEEEWLPTLTVAGKIIAQSSARDDGEVNTSPGSRRGEPTQVGGLFGAMTGGQSAAPKGNGIWSAEWIEFDIKAPGQPRRTIRRDVFDLIGPAARAAKDWSFAGGIASRRLERSLALVRQSELLILGWDLSPDYVEDVVTSGLLSQRTNLSQLMVATDAQDFQKVVDTMARGSRIPSGLNFALSRRALGERGGPVFLAEPNVFMLNGGVTLAEDKGFASYQEFDIVHNSVGVFPARDRNPFLVRLRHGVADTNAEALTLSDCCSGQPARTVNAAETLAATIDRGDDWYVAKRSADIGGGGAGLPPDVETRLQDELTGGSVLLVFRDKTGHAPQIRTGIWRIRADSGETIGLGENGAGGDVVSYVINTIKVGMSAYCFFVEYPNAKQSNKDQIWNHCVFWAFVGGVTAGVEWAVHLKATTAIFMFAIEVLAEGASKLAKETE